MRCGNRFSRKELTKEPIIMKKRFIFILTAALILSIMASSCAGGYTLPQRMLKQLQVGSGLTGSFVIHGNADSARYPLLNAIQDSEYEIVGIIADGNPHYHLFQTIDNENRSVPAEFFGLEGKYYFRSSFLNNTAYAFPDADRIISLFMNLQGENPAVLAKLMKILLSNDNSDDSFDTSSLERQIDNWISSYTPVTTIRKDSGEIPLLTEVFTIPVESIHETITSLIQYISQNDTAMSILHSVLSEDETALYFNPNLSYYYIEAMNSLDMKENIVFSRTVSTMGELLESTLSLPLDEKKTGYSVITIHNDNLRKSLQLTGSERLLLIDMPVLFSLDEKEFTETIRFAMVRSFSNPDKNLALNLTIEKKHEEHSDPEETTSYETDCFTIHAEHDSSVLPEGFSSDIIPESKPVDVSGEFRFSSKSQVYSSPTALEFSVTIRQDTYDYSVTGSVTTASPNKTRENYAWAFAPFSADNAIDTGEYPLTAFLKLISEWTGNASEKLIRTPEEIKQSVSD